MLLGSNFELGSFCLFVGKPSDVKFRMYISFLGYFHFPLGDYKAFKLDMFFGLDSLKTSTVVIMFLGGLSVNTISVEIGFSVGFSGGGRYSSNSSLIVTLGFFFTHDDPG